MKGTLTVVAALMMGVVFSLVVCPGCQQEQAQPDVKQARVLAAENAQLKSQIETQQQHCEERLAKQKQHYEQQIARQKKQLDGCRQQNESLTELSREGVDKYMQDIVSPLVDENRKLQETIKTLETQVEQLQAELKQARKEPGA